SAPAHREDVPGPQELLRGGGPHRVLARARHQAQRGRAARGLRADRMQRARAGAHGGRRPPRGQLRQHVPRPGRGRGQGQEGAVSRGAAAVLVLLCAPALAQEPPRLSERAHQDREIVYLLREPETHAFDLYHDYTESREGTDKYLNVVRQGSTVSNPGARILDTGAALKSEILKGEAITAA